MREEQGGSVEVGSNQGPRTGSAWRSRPSIGIVVKAPGEPREGVDSLPGLVRFPAQNPVLLFKMGETGLSERVKDKTGNRQV